MIDLDTVNELFATRYKRSAYRQEMLDWYDVASDGGDVARYLAGRPGPADNDAWREFLQQEKTEGKRRYRVHVLSRPLSPYLRYECEWGYVPNVAAGEEIRILDLTDIERPAALVDDEFWVLDDELVLIMKYDEEGRFLGAEVPEDIDPYLRARDTAMSASTDFAAWWERHPEEWRVNWLGR